MTNHDVRLAQIEARVAVLDAQRQTNDTAVLLAVAGIKEMIEGLETKHHERILDLERQYQRYQGAWGLLTIIGTAVIAAWAIFGDTIKTKLFGSAG